MFNLKNFGTNLKIQVSGEIDLDDDKAFFIGLMKTYSSCIDRSDALIEKFNLSLLDYEEPYVQIIENMMLKHYGEWKTELMLWYIYDRVSFNGDLNPIILEDEGKEKSIIINDPEELWEIIKNIESKIDKKDE